MVITSTQTQHGQTGPNRFVRLLRAIRDDANSHAVSRNRGAYEEPREHADGGLADKLSVHTYTDAGLTRVS